MAIVITELHDNNTVVLPGICIVEEVGPGQEMTTLCIYTLPQDVH